ncbi:hypothetical protein ACHAXT_008858 [Thalassiosira profunda]
MHILEAEDDPILHNYLPQLAFLNNEYYSRVKPYRMGKRDLPPNHIEVILRRRAVKKRADIEKVERRNGDSKGSGRSVPPPPPSGRPPLQHQHSPPRRKLFPTQQSHSPTPSSGKGGYYEDDSTISSTTVATQMTPGPPIQIQQSSEPPLVSQQQLNGATAIAISEIPREEVVGDTSLGLKLTILQGKVIVQKITPLEDGRASPAQLCGLLSPGDIIVAVNGKSLINGTIHNPVGMDKTISVLRPLSKPINEETKEYSREVRLRFVLGEGRPLLREQQEREKRKLEDRMHRKKLGLDGPRGAPDPAADLFGIGALMGVDQHSGMPMFAHLHHHHPHHEDDEKEEKKDAYSVVEESGEMQPPIAVKSMEKPVASFTRKRPSLQAQIARQIQLDRQWNRNRNTSGFYALDDGAPVLLRPPSPPPDHSNDPLVDTSINARKRRLERGAQTVADATSLVAVVEAEDRGIQAYEDEDPMEVASRVCGTASIRTGSSKRRWHRGDSASVVSASSAEPNIDMSTRSGWSGVEACDHRLLVELAASDESWKANVIRRLEAYAEETEKERAVSLHRGSSDSSGKEEVASTATGFDGLLFGGDVASMLGKKKQSLALPPGEMTSMLYDLVELLEGGLPDQIFTKDETLFSPVGPERTVSFAQRSSSLERMADVAKASDFLIHNALGKWLKSFRPLPWKQRRALWPSQPYGGDGDSTFASSRMDDSESLSMMSGSTAAQKSRKEDKRNLRELIEDLELDHETRRETCGLATFYFTRRISTGQNGIAEETENEAAAFLDDYGSYVDIYKCLVAAGKLRSRLIVNKLLGLAKFDYVHKGAVKVLQKAKALLFYEPAMLSALHVLLPSISSGQLSGDVDFAALLVSAYPDLQPWCVRDASESENSGGFYKRYLSCLLHHEEGNAAAKRDESLVKEWCLKLCAPDETDTETEEANREAFYHVASRDGQRSLLYRRDLPFLMDVSVKMSEFGLTLDLADEIISTVEGNEGELNAVLLAQAIAFFDRISPCVEEEHDIEFDSVAELSKLLEKCHTEQQSNPRYSPGNVDACIASLSQLNDTLEVRKETASKLITSLKVMLEETGLRIGDSQRNMHDLERGVVEGGTCPTNPDRYKAEKFMRYLDGKLYDQESALDKYRLKNSTLASKARKLEAQLCRDEETSFHYVDYHQMQVRQNQAKKDLESVASKVALRKISFEKSTQRVDALHTRLQDVKAKALANEKAVALREAYLERLDEEVYAKEDELDGLKNVLKNRADPTQVLEDEQTGPDYINQKAAIFELRETVKVMERKVDLAKGRRKLERRRGEQSKQVTVDEKRPARWAPRML